MGSQFKHDWGLAPDCPGPRPGDRRLPMFDRTWKPRYTGLRMNG